jgi:hypothetical protein
MSRTRFDIGRLAAPILALALAGCAPARSSAPTGDEGATADHPRTKDSSTMAERDQPPTAGGQQGQRVEKPDLQPVAGADQPPLPEGALLRFQHIYRGEGTAGNFRFVVYEDGRVFAQDNGGSDSDPPVLFTAPYPAQPTRVLGAAEVERIRAQIRQQGFLSLAPGYAPSHKVFGGDMQILEVRIDGKEHRVITDRVEHPAFSAVRDTAQAVVSGQ